jgi:hypothetical protein
MGRDVKFVGQHPRAASSARDRRDKPGRERTRARGDAFSCRLLYSAAHYCRWRVDLTIRFRMYRKSNRRKVARNVPKSGRPVPPDSLVFLGIRLLSNRSRSARISGSPGTERFSRLPEPRSICIVNVPYPFRESSRTREPPTFYQSCNNKPHRRGSQMFSKRDCRDAAIISVRYPKLRVGNISKLQAFKRSSSISRGQGRHTESCRIPRETFLGEAYKAAPRSTSERAIEY